jgi:hypothetical protein
MPFAIQVGNPQIPGRVERQAGRGHKRVNTGPLTAQNNRGLYRPAVRERTNIGMADFHDRITSLEGSKESDPQVVMRVESHRRGIVKRSTAEGDPGVGGTALD